MDQIKQFKGATDENVTILDINQIDIKKSVTINMDIFFSVSMHRLITKIAYEWYCLHNNITNKMDVFNNIIDFIVTGNSDEDPVELVSNEAVYQYFEQQSDIGNHTILSYIGLDNSVNIVVSLLGIAVYNVKLLPHQIENYRNNAVYQMVTIDAKRELFCFQTPTDLMNFFIKSFNEVIFPNGIKVMMPKNMQDTSLKHMMMYIQNYEIFQTDLRCIAKPTQQTIDLLNRQIMKIIQASALTIRGLKRFVKEHKEYLYSGLGLNPDGRNKKSIFLFYILFTVGQSGENWQGLSDLIKFVKEKFGESKIEISDDLSNNLLNEMLETDGYFEIIKSGAETIENWKYE